MTALKWLLLNACVMVSGPSFILGLDYKIPKLPDFNLKKTHPETVSQKDILDRLTELEERVTGLGSIETSKSTSSQEEPGSSGVSNALETKIEEVAQQVESLTKKTEDLHGMASKVSSLEKEVNAINAESKVDRDRLSKGVSENKEIILSHDTDLVKVKASIEETKSVVEGVERDVSSVTNEVMEIKELMVDDSACKDKGNLLQGKPSTDSQGNDDTDLCFISSSDPVPFWQVDLQGFYDITNITIRTCWGDWGYLAKSAVIEVYNVDPETCQDAESFLYGTVPSNAGPKQSHSFQASPPFTVRFIRISSTKTSALSIEETSAVGVGPKMKKVAKMLGPNKQVVNVLSTTTVSTPNACGELCDMADNCLAYSYCADVEGNCILSDCTSVVDATGWSTMVANYFHC